MKRTDINMKENKAGKWKNYCGNCGKALNNPTGNYCKWCGYKFTGIIHKTPYGGETETINVKS